MISDALLTRSCRQVAESAHFSHFVPSASESAAAEKEVRKGRMQACLWCQMPDLGKRGDDIGICRRGARDAPLLCKARVDDALHSDSVRACVYHMRTA